MSDTQDDREPAPFERKLVNSIDTTLGIVLAVLVFVMMVLTFVDVVGRQAFNAPVPAGFEVTALMMGFVVYLGFPIVSARQEHISIGLLDHLFKGTVRRIQRFIIHASGGVFSFIWARQVWIQGDELAAANELMMFLQIQTATFVYGMSILTFIGGLIFFVLAARSLIARHLPEREQSGI